MTAAAPTTARVTDLHVGDLIDLEGDPYADPNGDGTDPAYPDHFHAFAFEYAQVLGVDPETPDCTVVHTTQGTFGFPTDHRVPTA